VIRKKQEISDDEEGRERIRFGQHKQYIFEPGKLLLIYGDIFSFATKVDAEHYTIFSSCYRTDLILSLF
jgi:hypothetical protein